MDIPVKPAEKKADSADKDVTSHPDASSVAAKVLEKMKKAAPKPVEEKKQEEKPAAAPKPTEEKKTIESVPEQKTLITHEEDLKSSLDENISRKLE